jgi:hypothetical protein
MVTTLWLLCCFYPPVRPVSRFSLTGGDFEPLSSARPSRLRSKDGLLVICFASSTVHGSMSTAADSEAGLATNCTTDVQYRTTVPHGYVK